MKLPRDLSGQDLTKALRKLDYQITRQTSSHIRLTTQRGGEHHITPFRTTTHCALVRSAASLPPSGATTA